MHENDIDTETIHYNMKNSKNNVEMQLFSDKIINLVDELIEKNRTENKNNIEDSDENENQLVQTVYNTIAKFFVCNNDDDNLLSNTPRDWVCHNCGNFNFSQCINGKKK
eukprot:249282_1